MRYAIAAVVVAGCLGLVSNVYAVERGPGGGGGGGAVGGNIGVGGGGGANVGHNDGGAHVDGNVQGNVQGNVNAAKQDGDRNGPGVSVKAGQVHVEANLDRGRRSGHPEDLTDRDRRGEFNDRALRGVTSEDRWRYRRYGGDWWYWMPGNYWMYYRDGNWSRYNDSYEAYSEPTEATSNFNGPYYEDSNGFYYMDNGRKVYDSQIRRVQ